MNAILNLMRADESIAFWRAAESILELSGGFEDVAHAYIVASIGRGLTAPEADLLDHHVRTLIEEKK